MEHLRLAPALEAPVGQRDEAVVVGARLLALQGFWETIGFALNVFLFLLVGMQIRAEMLVEEASSIVLAGLHRPGVRKAVR